MVPKRGTYLSGIFCMSELDAHTPQSPLNICMTLFVVEYGDSGEEPGYIVRFFSADRCSRARLSGLLFSVPEGRAKHLMNDVWWVHEQTMELLVKTFPALRAQIEQLADSD